MRTLAAILTALVTTHAAAQTDPFNPAFTYQARLTDNGAPYNGPADINARLYNADAGGATTATLSFTNVSITDGLLTLDLDFGELPADTRDLWLEFEIDTGAGFTVLSPRQRMAPAPSACARAATPSPSSNSKRATPAPTSPPATPTMASRSPSSATSPSPALSSPAAGASTPTASATPTPSSTATPQSRADATTPSATSSAACDCSMAATASSRAGRTTVSSPTPA